MTRISKETLTMLATIEVRNDEIRKLEEEIAAQDQRIEGLKREADDARKNTLDYGRMFNDESAKCRKLQDIIATMDDKAIQRVKDIHAREMAGQQAALGNLQSHYDKCLGWIDAQLHRHPTTSLQLQTGAVNRQERPRDEMDEEIPF